MPETAQLSDAKRKLLRKYLQGRVEVRSESQTIPRRAPDEAIPLSYAQEQVWLHAQMAPDIPLYNEPVTIHYTGSLDVAILERSFNEILRRHEAWRTYFVTVDGAPVQKVEPSVTVSLPVVDLRNLPEEQREAEALRIATEDAIKPIDLTQAPLFRAKLIRLGDQQYRMYLTLSHIIFDGVAIYRVFLPELSTLYEAFAAGKPSPLPELAIQYPDYACWQRHYLTQEVLAKDLEYWKHELRGTLPELYLPSDRPHAGPQTFRGSMYPFKLNSDLTAKLRALSRAEGVALFPVLFAGFAALLYRYSGEELIPIGSVTAGRNCPETQPLLGYFLNTVVLRTDLSGDPTFIELVKRARNVIIGALEHDNLPFEHLVRELRSRRDPSHNPLFQALFSLEPPLPQLHPAWRLTQMDVDTGASKYDLYLELDERSDEILARFHYSTDLFDAMSMVRMAMHWQTLLEGAASNPECHLSDLPILSGEESRRLLMGWSDTARPYAQICVHRIFELQVEKSPNAVAVVSENLQLTYRELNERANQVSHYLSKRGVGPETRVVLCVERGLDMIVGLLGILKAGGAYVPLDPTFPEQRLATMHADAKPCMLLTQQRLRSLFPEAAGVVLMDAEWELIALEGKHNPDEVPTPENLAYVIYTSGSTGTPKGVQVEHRNVVNLLLSMQRELAVSSEDVLVAVTTLSFDIAGLELFLPLISGSTVIIASPEEARDRTLLLELIKRHGGTLMQATPTTWRMLIEAGWQGSPPLRVLCGGEALPPELGRELSARSASVWNVYGPTETTIWSSMYRLTSHERDSIPIGQPIANTQIYVLDRHQQPVPVNVVGEIYIGGDGVARGYFNRDQMTLEKFIPDPFAAKPQARLYKTGDQGRYRADGNIECLGRLDHQVKVRGFRVELGEVEAALGRHDGIRRSVVVVRQNGDSDKRLVAYIEPRPGFEPAVGDLRAHLKKQLPEYMLPSDFVVMDKLPMTSNGKIDRKALPIPDATRLKGQEEFVAPQDEIELILAQLWSKILGVNRVGVLDNFFELGGHSLLAVRLMVAIEKLFNRRLPLATLVQAPTIANLAQVLRQENVLPAWSSLVPIRPGGSRPPLFLMHSHGGNVLEYYPLANHLSVDQPVYALQARGLDGNIPENQSLEGMAKSYLEELKNLQPEGPYFLGGFCFGGLLALEAARQLTAAGEQVALVILIQTMNPVFARFKPNTTTLHHWWYRTAKRLDLERENLSSRGVSYIGQRSRDFVEIAKARTAIAFDNAFSHGQRRRSRPSMRYILESLALEHEKALRKYVVRPYSGDVLLFRASKQLSGLMIDESLGWKNVIRGNLDVCEIRGHQQTMLIEPNVVSLAEKLSMRLRLDQTRLGTKVQESGRSFGDPVLADSFSP